MSHCRHVNSVKVNDIILSSCNCSNSFYIIFTLRECFRVVIENFMLSLFVAVVVIRQLILICTVFGVCCDVDIFKPPPVRSPLIINRGVYDRDKLALDLFPHRISSVLSKGISRGMLLYWKFISLTECNFISCMCTQLRLLLFWLVMCA